MGCTERMPRAALAAHVAQCGYRTVVCAHCQKGVRAHSLQHHEEESCPGTAVECAHCQKVVRAQRLRHHEERECPHTVVACPNGCDVSPRPRGEFGCQPRVSTRDPTMLADYDWGREVAVWRDEHGEEVVRDPEEGPYCEWSTVQIWVEVERLHRAQLILL